MATRTWKGTTSQVWDTATNWLEGAVPVNGDDVVFPSSVTRTLLTGPASAVTLNSITSQQYVGVICTANITVGNIAITNAAGGFPTIAGGVINGTVTGGCTQISGGTFNGAVNAKPYNPASVIVEWNGATFNSTVDSAVWKVGRLSACVFKATTKFTRTYYQIVEIFNGTFDADLLVTGVADFKIHGGTFNGLVSGTLPSWSNGSLVADGGNFYGTFGGTYPINISGGTLHGDRNIHYLVQGTTVVNGNVSIISGSNVSGGTFSGNVSVLPGGYVQNGTFTGTVTVNGGNVFGGDFSGGTLVYVTGSLQSVSLTGNYTVPEGCTFSSVYIDGDLTMSNNSNFDWGSVTGNVTTGTGCSVSGSFDGNVLIASGSRFIGGSVGGRLTTYGNIFLDQWSSSTFNEIVNYGCFLAIGNGFTYNGPIINHGRLAIGGSDTVIGAGVKITEMSIDAQTWLGPDCDSVPVIRKAISVRSL